MKSWQGNFFIGFNRIFWGIIPLFLFFILLSSSAFSLTVSDEDMEFWTKEKMGSLQFGLKEAEVIKILGVAEKTEAPKFQQATGDYVKNWDYDSKGIFLTLSSPEEKGEYTINSIFVQAPCTLTTSHGIGIGSTIREVMDAYLYDDERDYVDPEGELIVGSIYGGIRFDFEKGKVKGIFFGAMAE